MRFTKALDIFMICFASVFALFTLVGAMRRFILGDWGFAIGDLFFVGLFTYFIIDSSYDLYLINKAKKERDIERTRGY